MNVSCRWLRQYVPTRLSALELGERFLLTSSELEGYTNWGERLVGLVVGRVLTVSAHPNAQRLRLALVDVGEPKPRHIVCGAPNLAQGQAVIVALPGVRLHPVSGEVVTLQEAIIRGEPSQGMLCAWEEIGIPLRSAGIVILESDPKPGTPAAAALELDDIVLDLEITPNRPDLLGLIGLARETSTFDVKNLKIPEVQPLVTKTYTEALDARLCVRYMYAAFDGIEICSSPWWLQRTLLVSGIKPINNVVDVTNYVMLETGQPLHAFDSYHSTVNPVIRPAKRGETLACLDGQTRTLMPDDIVVARKGAEPLALAGIIGGAASAITSETKNIIIECAVFDPAHIRRSSRRHGLRTEASTRMEKELDSEGSTFALARAVQLIQEICGGLLVEARESYPVPFKPIRPISVSYEQIQSLLGVHIRPAECKRILQRLGFTLSRMTKSGFAAVPPSWRRDVSLAEDIIEELIRIWGFERLPATLPNGPIQPPLPSPRFEGERISRHTLAALGFHECVSLSLVSKVAIEKSGFDPAQAVSVELPLSRENEYLLPDHLITFLGNLSGPNRHTEGIHLFEIGTVFSRTTETLRLSLLLQGTAPETLYREAKTAITRLFDLLERPVPECNDTVCVNGVVLGSFRRLEPNLMEAWKIRSVQETLYLTLDFNAILALPVVPRRFRPESITTIPRDLTVIVKESVPSGDVLAALNPHTAEIPVTMADIYRGDPLALDEKSLTFHLHYATDESEANADIEHLSARLIAQFSARINL
jgi:phenylalanyl-tRNA synthetase beta chain